MMVAVNFLLFWFFFFEIHFCSSIISIKSRCQPFEVCNVIHHRYWMPNLIEKQCMCPTDKFCPTTYVKSEKTFSLNISSRTQIQLCHPLPTTPLPMCSNYELSVLQTRIFNQIKTTINCLCDRKSFLKLYAKVTNKRRNLVTYKYQCIFMAACESNELCGYARTDLGFLYQKCTCPEGYNCVTRSSTHALNGRMHKLFYNGTVYPSYCTSFS